MPTIGHDGTLPPRTAAKRSRNPRTTKITSRLAWLTWDGQLRLCGFLRVPGDEALQWGSIAKLRG